MDKAYLEEVFHAALTAAVMELKYAEALEMAEEIRVNLGLKIAAPDLGRAAYKAARSTRRVWEFAQTLLELGSEDPSVLEVSEEEPPNPRRNFF